VIHLLIPTLHPARAADSIRRIQQADPDPRVSYHVLEQACEPGDYGGCPLPVHVDPSEENLGFPALLVRLSQVQAQEDAIFGFLHDDVFFHERWAQTMLDLFSLESMGVVGMAGGSLLGAHWRQALAGGDMGHALHRGNFFDTLSDESYRRCNEPKNVAVLDGLALFVRRADLLRWGGWQSLCPQGVGYLGYDYALCLGAHAAGKQVVVAPVRTSHTGRPESERARQEQTAGLPRNVHTKAEAWLAVFQALLNKYGSLIPREVKSSLAASQWQAIVGRKPFVFFPFELGDAHLRKASVFLHKNSHFCQKPVPASMGNGLYFENTAVRK